MIIMLTNDQECHMLTEYPTEFTPENRYPFLTGVKQRVISLIASCPPTAPPIEHMLIVVLPYTLLTSLRYLSSLIS